LPKKIADLQGIWDFRLDFVSLMQPATRLLRTAPRVRRAFI
jgi:hypothetical protein